MALCRMIVARLVFQIFTSTFVLLQAQALLTKNILYQKVDNALRQLSHCRPNVYKNIGKPAMLANGGESEIISSAQRDVMVANIRFLTVFYNYRHDTFAHAVQLLDMLLGQVKVSRKDNLYFI